MDDSSTPPPARMLEQMKASRADILAGRIVTSDAVMSRAFAAVERIRAQQTADPVKRRQARKA